MDSLRLAQAPPNFTASPKPVPLTTLRPLALPIPLQPASFPFSSSDFAPSPVSSASPSLSSASPSSASSLHTTLYDLPTPSTSSSSFLPDLSVTAGGPDGTLSLALVELLGPVGAVDLPAGKGGWREGIDPSLLEPVELRKVQVELQPPIIPLAPTLLPRPVSAAPYPIFSPSPQQHEVERTFFPPTYPSFSPPPVPYSPLPSLHTTYPSMTIPSLPPLPFAPHSRSNSFSHPPPRATTVSSSEKRQGKRRSSTSQAVASSSTSVLGSSGLGDLSVGHTSTAPPVFAAGTKKPSKKNEGGTGKKGWFEQLREAEVRARMARAAHAQPGTRRGSGASAERP